MHWRLNWSAPTWASHRETGPLTERPLKEPWPFTERLGKREGEGESGGVVNENYYQLLFNSFLSSYNHTMNAKQCSFSETISRAYGPDQQCRQELGGQGPSRVPVVAQGLLDLVVVESIHGRDPSRL